MTTSKTGLYRYFEDLSLKWTNPLNEAAVPCDSWESPKAHLNQSQSSLVQNFAGPFPYQCVGISFAKVCLKARLEAAVPSDELRTLIRMCICVRSDCEFQPLKPFYPFKQLCLQMSSERYYECMRAF